MNLLSYLSRKGVSQVRFLFIPGQEEPNLAFIQAHRLGWVALDARDQRALIAAIAAEPGMVQAMEATVKRYRAWNEAATAAIAARVNALADGVSCSSEQRH